MFTLALFVSGAAMASACTNLLVTPGAAADGSAILAYSADDMSLFGSLDLRPAADHAPGSVRQMYDWDGQYWTGTIPEVPHTLNVVGNVNELGVIITETTFGGASSLDGHLKGNIVSVVVYFGTTLPLSPTKLHSLSKHHRRAMAT